MGFEHEPVYRAMLLARLADHRHPRGVGFVTVERGAKVDQHKVAGRELATRRSQVRQRRVRPRLHERVERKVSAELADHRADGERNLDLALAGADPR